MQYNFQPQGDTVTIEVVADPDPENVAVADGSYFFDALRIANVGENPAFVKWGGETVEAAVEDCMPILPGTVESFAVPGWNGPLYVSAIGDGSTLYVTPGSGV